MAPSRSANKVRLDGIGRGPEYSAMPNIIIIMIHGVTITKKKPRITPITMKRIARRRLVQFLVFGCRFGDVEVLVEDC